MRKTKQQTSYWSNLLARSFPTSVKSSRMDFAKDCLRKSGVSKKDLQEEDVETKAS